MDVYLTILFCKLFYSFGDTPSASLGSLIYYVFWPLKKKKKLFQFSFFYSSLLQPLNIFYFFLKQKVATFNI